MAAAVSDFSPKPHFKKLSRHHKISLELVSNSDILKAVSAKKRASQEIIGFCLSESDSLQDQALKKLKEKGCDRIIANTPANLGAENRAIQILDANTLSFQCFENLSLSDTASKILTSHK